MIVRYAVLAVVLLPALAGAHDRTTSYSSWRIDGRTATVRTTVSALDLSRFPWAGDAERVAAYLSDHLVLRAGDVRCAVHTPRALTAEPGRVHHEWMLDCSDGPLAIESRVLAALAPGHLHFARVERSGAAPAERLLSEAAAVWQLDGTTPAPRFFPVGVTHILTGWDHLAFLAALLLVARGVGDVLRMVTGFTLAHSLTLGLAALGIVQPAGAPVEALIALTIALVAAENVWLADGQRRVVPAAVTVGLAALALAAAAGHGRVPWPTFAGLALFSACWFGLLTRARHPAGLRTAAAFGFGLVHGLGFAGVLVEAALAPAQLVRALLGFNLGVEAGQLAVVLLAWPLLRLLARRPLAVELGSAAIAGLGVFWFISRAYG